MRVNNLLGDDPRKQWWEEGQWDRERKKLKDVLLNELPWWTTRAPSHGKTSGDSVDHASDIPAEGWEVVFPSPATMAWSLPGRRLCWPPCASQEKAHCLQVVRPWEPWCGGADTASSTQGGLWKTHFQHWLFHCFLHINDILKSGGKTDRKNTHENIRFSKEKEAYH